MSRQVAFLRAINVGGHGVVKMAAVQAAFTKAGCRNVTTYIASGNILFDAPDDMEAVKPRVARAMRTLLDAEPVIVYRTARELRALADAAPFGTLVDDRTVKLYVAFALQKTKSRPAFPLAQPKEALEAIGMMKSDILIVSRPKPTGMMYGFPANWIEKELGVVVTARNWSTVTKLAELTRTQKGPA